MIPRREAPQCKPNIPAEEVADWSQRDQKLLLAFSVLAQKMDWVITQILADREHARQMEREMLRIKQWKKTFVMRGAVITGVVGFALTTVLGGLLGSTGKAIASHLFGTSPSP